MSSRVPVYDSGMLIALADRKAKAVRLHEGLREVSHRAVVPGPVLGQVWRPTPSTVHALAMVMRDCTVPHARSTPGPFRSRTSERPACLMCITPMDIIEWHRIGGALSAATLPAKKRPDVVDALVAMTAARHGSAAVFTSDPDDIQACLKALDAHDVRVIAV